MPEQRTRQAAARDKRQGKSPSTQAGEFVKEEIEHIREGKHGASSAKQAIAIGLSKARRAGVKVPPRKSATAASRRKDAADERAAAKRAKPNPVRSRATKTTLKKEGQAAASHRALSTQARKAAGKRAASSRSAAANKAARTKGATGRSAAAKKAAVMRARRARSP